MKTLKTYLLIAANLTLTIGSKAQTKIDNQIAEVRLPKGSKSIATTDVEAYGKRNFKRDLKPFEIGKTFAVDGVLLVSIGELKKSATTKKSLEKWKRQLESVYKQTNQTWDSSKIDTINGNRFYIFEDHRDDDYLLSFFSEDVGDKGLNGNIAYKAKNRDKAHLYLNNLLKDVKLKK